MDTQKAESISPRGRKQQEIDNNFKWHEPKTGDVDNMNDTREIAKEFATHLNEVCPQSRELSLALTKLEEVVFWANASIVRYPKEVEE